MGPLESHKVPCLPAPLGGTSRDVEGRQDRSPFVGSTKTSAETTGGVPVEVQNFPSVEKDGDESEVSS